MAAKKRNSPKNKRGVSGNPRRRAEQLRTGAPAGTGGPGDPAMRDLAYRMAGGAEPALWWPESHERVLARARAAAWPRSRAGVEELTGRLVGGELFDCVRRHSAGHHPAQWLVALTETAGTALRTALAAGNQAASGPDHPADPDDAGARGLWSLLCGIALTAPRPAGDDPNGTGRLASRYFPAVKDPYETALAEAGRAAALLADLGTDTGALAAAAGEGGGCRPAGAPLVARDEFGSRFLLAAPFAYAGGAPEAGGAPGPAHWYAWDIDACWIDVVVGAGAFGSADEALKDWRSAAGPAADGADLAACPPELAARLLAKSLQTGPFEEFMRGGEPRELLWEYFRQRRRARELARDLPDPPKFMVDLDQAREEFLRWYAERHGRDALAAGMAEAVDTITDQWGPHRDIDDQVFRACSPHRVETAARLIRNGHYGEHAGPAIRLLPEWTRWCAERGGLGGAAAARALDAARSAAAALAGAGAAIPGNPESGPFRRSE